MTDLGQAVSSWSLLQWEYLGPYSQPLSSALSDNTPLELSETHTFRREDEEYLLRVVATGDGVIILQILEDKPDEALVEEDEVRQENRTWLLEQARVQAVALVRKYPLEVKPLPSTVDAAIADTAQEFQQTVELLGRVALWNLAWLDSTTHEPLPKDRPAALIGQFTSDWKASYGGARIYEPDEQWQTLTITAYLMPDTQIIVTLAGQDDDVLFIAEEPSVEEVKATILELMDRAEKDWAYYHVNQLSTALHLLFTQRGNWHVIAAGAYTIDWRLFSEAHEPGVPSLDEPVEDDYYQQPSLATIRLDLSGGRYNVVYWENDDLRKQKVWDWTSHKEVSDTRNKILSVMREVQNSLRPHTPFTVGNLSNKTVSSLLRDTSDKNNYDQYSSPSKDTAPMIHEAITSNAAIDTKDSKPTQITLPPLLQQVMPHHQRQFLKQIAEEEVAGMQRIIDRLEEVWQNMPGFRAQDGKGKQAVVHAHYFKGSSDWWITEYDPAEDMAYGYVVLNGDIQFGEFGNIYLPEVITTSVELDFHWQPVTVQEALSQDDQASQEQTVTTLPPSSDESLWINDNYYVQYPAHVYDEFFYKSGRYGEAKSVRSTDLATSLARMDTGGALLPSERTDFSEESHPTGSQSKEQVSTKPPINTEDHYFEKAITRSAEELAHKAKTQKKRTEKRKTKGNSVETSQTASEVFIAPDDAIIFSAEEVAHDYNEGLTEEDFKLFAYYKRHQKQPLGGYYAQFGTPSDSEVLDWMQRGKAFYYQGEILPDYIYLSEDIYAKQDRFQRERSLIISKYGAQIAERQEKALEAVFQQHYRNRLLLDHRLPEGERLSIELLSSFSDTFQISALVSLETFKIKKVTASTHKRAGQPDFLQDHKASDYNREEVASMSLKDAFCTWLIKQENNITFKKQVTSRDIISVHVFRRPRPRDFDPTAWSAHKAACKQEADRLYSEFLSTEVVPEDRSKIETAWNREFNNYLPIDYTRVPIAFRMAKTYRDAPVDIRSEKRDAVTFLLAQGSGCLAYDVGFGKAQPLDAGILTPTGWSTMGQLRPGSIIVGANGKPTTVTQIHPQGSQEVYRVCFSDGSHTETCGEHLWKVQTINHRAKYPNAFYIKTTDEIAATIRSYRGVPQYSIPMVEAVAFEKQELPMPPYLMGVLIGDGTLRQHEVLFSTKDKELLDLVEETLPATIAIKKVTGSLYDYRLSRMNASQGVNPLIQCMRALGLAGKKSFGRFIPDVYKYTSVDDRLELLRGLMDTDGTVGKRKTGCHVSFTTVSHRLMEDVKELVQSLGGTVSLYARIPNYTHQGERRQGQLSYTLTLQLPAHLIPFRLSAKMAKFVPRSKYQPARYITEIIPVGKKETQCISVAAPDHLYVTDDFIVTHNTWSAIFAMSQFLDAQLCYRPLLVVPNQVYKQFLMELKGLMPHIPVNEYYNLDAKHLSYAQDHPPEDGSITIVTYEGFKKIGFNEQTSRELIRELLEILSQGYDQQTRKKMQAQREKMEERVGQGLQGTLIEIEQFGWDFLCVDEAHSMKKVFTSVKGEVQEDGDREKNQYEISSGTPSAMATKGFMIAQYILRRNHYRNVLLLTATPFTNSPLEVYSMLSLVAYQGLQKAGVKSIKTFYDQYVAVDTKLVINAKLEPQRKQVVTGFSNLKSLQALIYRYFDRKDINTKNAKGEGVQIKRPKKYVLPMRTKTVQNADGQPQLIYLKEDERIEPILPLTEEQQEIMDSIKRYASGEIAFEQLCIGFGEVVVEGDTEVMEEEAVEETAAELLDIAMLSQGEQAGVRLLRSMNLARNLALSPYLHKCSNLPPLTYKTYVETSPKLYYVMQCIRSVKEHHQQQGTPVSGQVIYMDRGVDHFRLLKEYLVHEIGYAPHEVGLMRSNMASVKPKGVKTAEAKDYVKNLFLGQKWVESKKEFVEVPDAERIKVVIGTGTIKEGVNLQRHGTVLYNCFIDWNPTDQIQLEGRIWRQGNLYKNVRIVNVLMEDSADIFLFQKLEEKTQRINQLWNRDGNTNTFNLDEFDPEELKYTLISDPAVIAQLEVEEEIGRLQDEKYSLSNEITQIESVLEAFRDRKRYEELVLPELQKLYLTIPEDKEENIAYLSAKLATIIKTQKLPLDGDLEGKAQRVSILEYYEKGAGMQETYSHKKYQPIRPYWFTSYARAQRLTKRFEESYLVPKGWSVEGLPEQARLLQEKIVALDKRGETMRSPEAMKSRAFRIMMEREEAQISSKSLEARVGDFISLNHLLDERKEVLQEAKDEAPTIEEVQVALEGLTVLRDISEGAEKEEVREAIAVMEILLELAA